MKVIWISEALYKLQFYLESQPLLFLSFYNNRIKI